MLAISTFLLVVGCESDSHPRRVEQDVEPGAQLVIVATVNGEPITEQDVDFALTSTFSTLDVLQAGPDLREKVLESLIASRAMKQAVVLEMDADEIASIKQKADAYEEELFVRAYLSRHAEPQPVTQQQIDAYYQQYPEQFGGQPVFSYELVRFSSHAPEANKQALFGQANVFQRTPRWREHVSNWQTAWGLDYQAPTSIASALAPELRSLLLSLKVGETTNWQLLGDEWIMLRLIKLDRTQPKPLTEVSADIRQRLAPLQVRKAVQSLTERVVSQARVERTP